jgi:hypothetical protein
LAACAGAATTLKLEALSFHPRSVKHDTSLVMVTLAPPKLAFSYLKRCHGMHAITIILIIIITIIITITTTTTTPSLQLLLTESSASPTAL